MSPRPSLATRIPMLALGALCLRLMACGNDAPGTGGGGAAAMGGGGAGGIVGSGGACLTLPKPTCLISTGQVTYASGPCDAPVSHDMTCPGPCEVVSPDSVRCSKDRTIQTCIKVADCSAGSLCFGSNLLLLTVPSCVDGLCQWQHVTNEVCTISCSNGSCETGVAGTTSASFPAGTPAACNDGVVTFGHTQGGSGAGGHVIAHTCKGACFTDTTGSGCVPVAGEPPFHTCETLSDSCPKSPTMCDPADPSQVVTYLTPSCTGYGDCAWLAKTVTPCPAGTTCKVDSCVP